VQTVRQDQNERLYRLLKEFDPASAPAGTVYRTRYPTREHPPRHRRLRSDARRRVLAPLAATLPPLATLAPLALVSGRAIPLFIGRVETGGLAR
jgi:hypothetical protein